MKHQIWLSLPLAAALAIPAVAQQNDTSNTTQNPPAAAQSTDQPAQATTEPGQPHQPLQAERHEGFWGKINPMARKKYVQRQMEPIRNRVNELDELTSSNARAIKDVDSRAQEGIRLASAKATEADQHAIDAGNRAQQASQIATQAGTRLNTVEQVVGNIDQYQPVTQAEIRFKPGQAVLSTKAKEALDQMAQSLNGQKGYIVEVQGFSSGKGQTAVTNSQRMAQAVVRYLVVNHNVPVYRVYLMGMGNARPANAQTAGASAKRTSGGRVEVSLLKNNVEQLAAAASPNAMPGTEGGTTGTTAQPQGQQPNTGTGNEQPSAPQNPPAPQQ